MKIVFTTAEVRDMPQPDMYLFVEVEDDQGKGINVGEWGKHKDGVYDTLTISTDAHIAALAASLLELEQRNALENLLSAQQTPRSWQRLTPDELGVLSEYRLKRGVLAAGESVQIRIMVSADQPHLVVCEDTPPIPADVYYSPDMGNFYSLKTKQGMGDTFYYKWRERAGEFPEHTEAARAAHNNQGIQASMQEAQRAADEAEQQARVDDLRESPGFGEAVARRMRGE